MKNYFKRTAKAWVAAAVAALAFAGPVIDDGLIPSEVLGILLAALAAWQGVYWTPNRGTRD